MKAVFIFSSSSFQIKLHFSVLSKIYSYFFFLILSFVIFEILEEYSIGRKNIWINEYLREILFQIR